MPKKKEKIEYMKNIALLLAFIAFLILPSVAKFSLNKTLAVAATPSISSITPTSALPAATLRINGTDLAETVQFFDATGNLFTVTGIVNDSKTQTMVLVPADLSVGNVTVKVYLSADSVSNGIILKIKDIHSVIKFAKETSIWRPTQTNNGWWSSLSPNGRYVSYGNGESWVTDLLTKKNYDMFHTTKTIPVTAGCYAAQWIKPNVGSFSCFGVGKTYADSYRRFEFKIGEWKAHQTPDDPGLVAGNAAIAKDGHWATFLASQGRIVEDNKVIATGVGGIIGISGDLLAYSCSGNNTSICVAKNGKPISKYIPKITNFGADILNGYIVYGGGRIRGINPNRKDTDISVTPPSKMGESGPKLVLVNGKIWVATWSCFSGTCMAYIRPWGERKSIVVDLGIAGLNSIVYANNKFVIATQSDKGGLTVRTISASSPRNDLFRLLSQ